MKTFISRQNFLCCCNLGNKALPKRSCLLRLEIDIWRRAGDFVTSGFVREKHQKRNSKQRLEHQVSKPRPGFGTFAQDFALRKEVFLIPAPTPLRKDLLWRGDSGRGFPRSSSSALPTLDRHLLSSTRHESHSLYSWQDK